MGRATAAVAVFVGFLEQPHKGGRVQDLFATSFDVANEDPDAAFDRIARGVMRWAYRGEGKPPDLSSESQGSRDDGEFHLRWSLLSVPDRSERAVEFELRHKDRATRGIEWRSVAELCRGTHYLRLSLRIAREATELRLAPAAIELRRPNIIPTVLRRFECRCGGVPLGADAHVLQVGEVESFVESVLLSAERSLPVLVVSTASGATGPEVDVDELADELSGLAHVVTLGGYLAWERFREQTGASSFVPPGGARMYWPGFGHARERLHHPYWTRRALGNGRLPLHEQVFRKLSRLSVGRVPRDPLVRELQRAVRERRLVEAREGADDTELLDTYEHMLKDSEEERDGLEAERDHLQQLVEQLTENNQRLVEDTERQAKQWASLHRSPEVTERADEPEDVTVETWEEFADLAQVLEGPSFVLTERAREQCRVNDYPDPGRMWSHLEALAQAAEAYNEAGASVGGRLKEWIAENFHIEIALFDQDLQEETFELDGQAYSREPHVKVDDFKSPDKCGRIYFAADPDRRRFIVDHIGLHL
jgi:hypothetical protein